jgi:hypothetical protein
VNVSGAFDLRTPQDWLDKLGRELQRLRASPNDRDAAINFFIAAESMLDWKYPGDSNASVRKGIRDSEPLLKVVWNLASKSKHFDKLRPQHQYVDDSGTLGEFFGGEFFGGKFFGALSVKFKAGAASHFGPSMPALELAEKVFAYWRAHC